MTRPGVPLLLLLASACVLPRPIQRAPAARAEPPEPVPRAPTHSSWHAIGYSTERRPIEVQRVGHGPRRVLWIGGIHGTEREGSAATESLAAAIRATPELAERVRVTVVRDLNPDGSERRRRGNAGGIDLNRNFPASNFHGSRNHGWRPLDQPESRALHDLIRAERPDLVMVCHGNGSGRSFVNYDGPARSLAELFSELSGYPVVASDALHATPGSLGTWVGIDLGIPILTLEYRRGMPPEQAWNETRDAILAALAGPADL